MERTLLGQCRKDPRAGPSAGHEQLSQPASALAQGAGSQGFKEVHSFLSKPKRGFVIISCYKIKPELLMLQHLRTLYKLLSPHRPQALGSH